MHFRVAVRNFHVFNASRWVPHMVVVTISRIVVVRWPEQLPLWLPSAIKSLITKETSHNPLIIATRATTLWLKTSNLFFQCTAECGAPSFCSNCCSCTSFSERFQVAKMLDYTVSLHCPWQNHLIMTSSRDNRSWIVADLPIFVHGAL